MLSACALAASRTFAVIPAKAGIQEVTFAGRHPRVGRDSGRDKFAGRHPRAGGDPGVRFNETILDSVNRSVHCVCLAMTEGSLDSRLRGNDGLIVVCARSPQQVVS